jgi:hypothetical protein
LKNYQRELTFLTQKSEAETSNRVDNFFICLGFAFEISKKFNGASQVADPPSLTMT